LGHDIVDVWVEKQIWVVNKFHLSPVMGDARHASCLTTFSMPETYLISHDLSPKSCMRICTCCAVADGGGFKHLCPIQNPLYEEDKEGRNNKTGDGDGP